MAYSRTGQADAAGSVEALFLEKFGGRVHLAYENATIMEALHDVIPISGTNAFKFPAVGSTTASYFAPGDELTGKAIKHNTRTIYLDDKLISDVTVDELDELKNHWRAREAFATKAGEALAQVFDQKALRMAVIAARAAATVSGGQGGSTVSGGATVATDGNVLANALRTAAQTLDEKNVPENGRNVVLKPAQYYLLLDSDKLLSKDFSGSNGDVANGKIEKATGLNIVKSNNLPSTNVAAATAGEQNTYTGDFTNTVAAVFHREAIATVRGMGLSMEVKWQTEFQRHLIVAKMAVGQEAPLTCERN